MDPCTRCHGLMVEEEDYSRCVNCGGRSFPPFIAHVIKLNGRASLVQFRVCDQCNGEALDGRRLCWDCQRRLRKDQPARRIARLSIL